MRAHVHVILVKINMAHSTKMLNIMAVKLLEFTAI